MSLLGAVGRTLLALPFLAAGVDAIRHPGPQTLVLRPVARRMAAQPGLSRVPADPEPLIRGGGGLAVLASTGLALGVAPRTCAGVLAVSTAPVVCARHPYWRHDDPLVRREVRRQLIQDLGLVGAALLVAAGPPATRSSRSSRSSGAIRGTRATHGTGPTG